MDEFQSYFRIEKAYEKRLHYGQFLEPRLRELLSVIEFVNKDFRTLYCALIDEWLSDGFWWIIKLGDEIGGFAIPPTHHRKSLSIYANGVAVPNVEWGLPSEVDQKVRPWLNNHYGFKAPYTWTNGEVEFALRASDASFQLPVHTNFWLVPTKIAPPSGDQLRRISCGNDDPDAHAIVGASLFKKFDRLCKEHIGKSINDADGVLDWGCGWGRVMRYFGKADKLIGADIDPVNIAWAKQENPIGRYIHISPTPPIDLPSGSVEVIYSNAVFNHLREEHQNAWLRELRRLIRSGGLLIVTLNSHVSWALLGWFEVSNCIRWLEEGFSVGGENADLADVLKNGSYVDVAHTHAYIHRVFSQYFHVIDILEGFTGGGLAAVVMRAE